MNAARHRTAAFAHTIIGRREQTAFRIGLAAVVAAIFQFETGWLPALVWFAAYAVPQLAERRLFRNVTASDEVSPRMRRGSAVLVFFSAAAAQVRHPRWPRQSPTRGRCRRPGMSLPCR
jgi:hypothetical protein